MSNEQNIWGQEIEDQYQFLSPSFFGNPYPFYAAIRAIDPVHWSDKTKSWIVTSYEDVYKGLRRPVFTAKRTSSYMTTLSGENRASLEDLENFYSQWLMYMEEPDHGRIKKLTNRPFSPQAVEKQTVLVEQRADILVASLFNKKEMDILTDFATPLALYAMGNMLGIPEEDYPLILKWSHDLVGFLGARNDVEKAKETQKTLGELSEYLEPVLAQGPDTIESDLLSVLVRGRQDGVLSDEELLAVVANILIDGHEPMANVITNGMLAILQNSEQLQLLQQNPSLIVSAVEEVIRFDPPFQYAARTALADTILGRKQIKAGDRVQFMLGAANHDPNKFDNPDALDITREPNPHSSFGFGIHYCPGARLGRTVVEKGIQALVQKLPQIQLSESQLQWQQSLGYRGLKCLKVNW